jgi:hypothetical protein
MKKKARASLRHIELGATIVLAVILGFVWWHAAGVLRNASSATEAQRAMTYKNYVDTAKVYSFLYSEDWTLTYAAGGRDYADGSNIKTDDWSKTSRPATIQPSTGHSGNVVMIQGECSNMSIATLKKMKDKFHTQQAMEINGYPTLYDKLAFTTDAESYVHHTYVLEHGGHCLTLSYRENWHHAMSNTNFDDHQNVAAFEAIVHSVRFLN